MSRLLETSDKFSLESNEIKMNHQFFYHYSDQNNGPWIRNGNLMGHDLHVRYKEQK